MARNANQNEMFLNTTSSTNNYWEFDFNVKKSEVTLNTKDKYLDKDIKIVPKLGSVVVGTNLTDETYIELKDKIVPENGFLYIKGGFHSPVKISLATLVPDAATISGVLNSVSGSYESPTMLSGTTAYDKDGKLIVGSLSTIEVPTKYYSTTAGVTASKLEAGNLGQAQYIKQGSATIGGGVANVTTNYNGTPDVSAEVTVDSSNLTITTEATKPVNPTDKYTFTVNAGSEPLSGTTKVTVPAISVSNITAGWMERDDIGYANALVTAQQVKEPTVTVNAGSDETYYSIAKAVLTPTKPVVAISGLDSTAIKPTATMSLGSASTMASGIATLATTTTTDEDKVYIEIDGSTSAVSSAKTVGVSVTSNGKVNVTQGYVGADIKGDVTVAVTTPANKTISLTAADTLKRYLTLPKVTCAVEGGGVTTNTNGKATLATPTKSSGLSADLTLATSAPSSGDYWTLKAQATKPTYNVSAVTLTNGAGYVDANAGVTKINGATAKDMGGSITTTNYYIPKTSYTTATSTPTSGIQTVNGSTTSTTSINSIYEVKVATAGYDFANDSVQTFEIYTGQFTVSES